jgi:kynurenine formamidase
VAKQYTREDIQALLHDRNNWGRWGADDEVGAVNLITASKRAAAASLVKSGRSVSLSRMFPTTPAPNNPRPASHYMKQHLRPEGSGAAVDYVGLEYHGITCTHIDALCHTWDSNGMWNGRRPDDVLDVDGAAWGSIDKWKEGIITRGVLLDVPAFRGEPYVTNEKPVTGEELAAIAKYEGVAIEPGDALVIYSGRDRWDNENPVWGSLPTRPGLHGSCLEFLRDVDAAVIAWDMQDSAPNEWDLPWTVHGVIFAYGIGIVDNCDLAPVSQASRAEGRFEFMFVLSPLYVPGGTGSPANPLAVF